MTTALVPGNPRPRATATATPTPSPAPEAPPAGPMSRREQWAFVVFATWSVIGLFLDGWAHNHQKPETFFTPWHAVLYSGVAAGALFFAFESWRQARAGIVRAPVAGERLTTIGLVLFGIGMVGDFAWHTAFGIEQGVDALLSPTHLLLMTGGLMLTSAPYRAELAVARERMSRPTATVPVVVSVTLSAALVGFFLQFVSAFRDTVASQATAISGRGGYPELMMMHGVSAVLLTNLVLLAAGVMLLRFRLRPGMLTAGFGGFALMFSGIDSFHRGAIVLAAVMAGLVADAIVHAGRLDLALPVASGVLWLNWFGLLALTGPMAWNQNFWAGTVFLAVLEAIVITMLASLRRID
jgi:hypothetical protein